jgi:NAD kinase
MVSSIKAIIAVAAVLLLKTGAFVPFLSRSSPAAARLTKRNIDPLVYSTNIEEEPLKNGQQKERVAEQKSSEIINRPPTLEPQKRKKMNLLWCTNQACSDVSRERVVGEHNQIVLNGPATGQVAYIWNGETQQQGDSMKSPPYVPSVLLLVKRDDEELMEIAATAVKQLTGGNIQVLLAPDLAAKLKHYYGVDDTRIRLFEQPKELDMGGKKEDWTDDSCTDELRAPFPDLVCTLGGDGLLLYASMIFQGAVPPILTIAGGSLGFLTPFTKDEMVDAVRIALGMGEANGGNSTTSSRHELEVFPPNMPSYPYEPLVKPPHVLGSTPRFSFGLGEAICLSMRMRLDCRVVNREGVVRARFHVLNEVVIDRGSSPYLAALECFCDDVHLTTVQADGVIFAT